MIDIVLKLILAYLAGCVMGGLLIGRLRHVDIRTVGSGNAGGTNALRTQGKLFALAVIIIDIGKGALAAGWIPTLTWYSAVAPPQWLPLACAALAVVGHVYPVFYGLRGGKGAATLVGSFLVLAPVIVLPLLAVWISTIVLSGYVGLATMVTGQVAWILLALLRGASDPWLVGYAALMGLFMIFTHRSNIRRMRAGSESRNTRLMLFRRQ